MHSYNIKLKVPKLKNFRWGWFTEYKTRLSRNTRRRSNSPIILSFRIYQFLTDTRSYKICRLELEHRSLSIQLVHMAEFYLKNQKDIGNLDFDDEEPNMVSNLKKKSKK
jgi:hypothetical protein